MVGGFFPIHNMVLMMLNKFEQLLSKRIGTSEKLCDPPVYIYYLDMNEEEYETFKLLKKELKRLYSIESAAKRVASPSAVWIPNGADNYNYMSYVTGIIGTDWNELKESILLPDVK